MRIATLVFATLAFVALPLHAVTLWPDYTNTTVPPNIAPLNFDIGITGDAVVTTVLRGVACDAEISHVGREVRWNAAAWQRFLAATRGDAYTITIMTNNVFAYCATNRVAKEAIDTTLVYRLIPPSYEGFTQLGIYQRNLTSFDENPIFVNNKVAVGEWQCVNCHAFHNHDPNTLSLHLRVYRGGTVIYTGKDDPGRKRNFKIGPMISNGVYPAWHPNGKYIAYSINETAQSFYTANLDKIEVADSQSDMALYNIETDTLTPVERDPAVFETFPTWTPDGLTLYTCAARPGFATLAKSQSERFANVQENYTNMHYNVIQRTFDPATGRCGAPVVLLDAAISGMSVIHPRVSPDGRWMVVTAAPYGTFHIWHRTADLYIIDLQAKTLRAMNELNSPNVESYHTFSSNGAWIVFSSRRDDGCYTRPYFAHFDAARGVASKPFILPVEAPQKHLARLLSYNVPEFVTGPITRSVRDIRALATSPAQDAKYCE